MEMTTTRRRANYWHVMYGQWVTAGKIALATHAMPAIEAALARDNKADIYHTNDGAIAYSIIGQEYLQSLNISIYQIA